jgi:U3 small nucleolar RNA-associated protein 4
VSKPVSDDEENNKATVEASGDHSRKRKQDEIEQQTSYRGSWNCSICLQYNGILYLNFVGQREMVVVEQPWLEVVETFPDAIQRSVYGTN